jgi:hypothetical protein
MSCFPYDFISTLGVHDVRYTRAALLATAAAGMLAVAMPAYAEVVVTPDSHYYRLLPVRAPLPGAAPEMATIIPGQATASVPKTSSWRLINFQTGEYQPEYTTVCGPP